jgi:hypothetical protein
MMSLVVCALALGAGPPVARAQTWTRLFDGAAGGDETAVALARDAAGNLFVAGSTSTAGGTKDLLLLKYSSAGTLLWQAQRDIAGTDDEAVALTLDSQGDPIVVGSIRTVADHDVAVVKYGSGGGFAWARTFAGPGSSDDEPVAVGTDASDRVVVCASTFSPSNGPDILVLQYAPDGTPNWQTQLDGGIGAGDDPVALAVTSAGDITVSAITTAADGSTDLLLARWASSGGVPAWTRSYSGSGSFDDWPRALALDGAGRAYVTGFQSVSDSSADCVVLKYEANGTLAWARTFDGETQGWDEGSAVIVDGAGSVFVAGATPAVNGSYDFLTLDYTAAGALVWARTSSGPGDGWDEAGSLVPDGSGGVVVTGISESTGQDSDFLTLHYDPSGTVVGMDRRDGSAHGFDVPAQIVSAGPPLVAIAGVSAESGSGDDVLVTTLDPSSLVGVDEDVDAEVLEAVLEPLEPNPLQGSGTVRFQVPAAARATLEIVDVTGRVVKRMLVDEAVTPGRHSRRLEWKNRASGLYFVRLTLRGDSGKVVKLRKVALLR